MTELQQAKEALATAELEFAEQTNLLKDENHTAETEYTRAGQRLKEHLDSRGVVLGPLVDARYDAAKKAAEAVTGELPFDEPVETEDVEREETSRGTA